MTRTRNDPLTLLQKLAYGVGHVQNDLFAAMWFSYLLLYLQFVMQIPATTAGVIFLIGQFCDGLVTPILAHKVDRLRFPHYGKRKTVHFIGSVVVSLAFPFVFTRCSGCEDASYWTLVVYFVPLVCLFHCGWAAVQMCHLSLIPELSSDQKQRDELNIIRYAFDILTDTSVYLIALAVLTYHEDTLDPDDTIGPENSNIFRNMALILLGTGIIFSVIFHVFTPEKKGTVSDDDSAETPSVMVWKDWFKFPSFYKVGILFAVSRVITNILQAFVPLYLQEGIRAPHNLIALIPLVINVSGFFSSLLMKPLMRIFDKKLLFKMSATMTLISCLWFAWDEPDSIRDGNIYAIAILSGIGSSTMLVLALSFAADLVGDHTNSGGFVYGCLALAEKVTNGVAILAFQAGRGICTDCTTYYRDVLSFGICFFTAANLISVLLLREHEIPVMKCDPINVDDGEIVAGPLLRQKKTKYGATKRGFQLFGDIENS